MPKTRISKAAAIKKLIAQLRQLKRPRAKNPGKPVDNSVKSTFTGDPHMAVKPRYKPKRKPRKPGQAVAARAKKK